IDRAQRVLSADDLKRRALLRACFRKEESAVLELEDGKHDLRTDPRFLAGLAPAQAAGDHQMDHEKQLIVELESDAFADAPKSANDRTADGIERRIDRAEDERAEQTNLIEAPAENPRAERFDINDDVGEFGHVAPRVPV